MSYILNAWSAPVPRDLAESLHILDRLQRLTDRPDAALDEFAAALLAAYPCAVGNAGDVWLDTSLLQEPRGPVLAFGVQSNALSRALPDIVAAAAKTGVVLHDPQAGVTFLADGFALTAEGRQRVDLAVPSPDSDADLADRQAFEKPAPVRAGVPYLLHLFHEWKPKLSDCEKHVEWAASVVDPVEWRAAEAGKRPREFHYWQLSNPYIDFERIDHAAQRLNARVQAAGIASPWANRTALEESAPRMILTLQVRGESIGRIRPLVFEEAARQGLIVYDPQRRMQVLPPGPFIVEDRWHGHADDTHEHSYEPKQAALRLWPALEPAFDELGFKLMDGGSERHRRFERIHGETRQWLSFFLDPAHPGVALKVRAGVELHPSEAPHRRWARKDDGREVPLRLLGAMLMELAGVDSLKDFPFVHDGLQFYRAAHVPEVVRTIGDIVRNRLLPRLAPLQSAEALFDAMTVGAGDFVPGRIWHEELHYLAHLAGRAEAQGLLAAEEARIAALGAVPEWKGRRPQWILDELADGLRRIRVARGEAGQDPPDRAAP
jgi:hypothetical protein